MPVVYFIPTSRVEWRVCPGCGWLESQRVVEQSVQDITCKGCEEYRGSSFVPYPGIGDRRSRMANERMARKFKGAM